MAITGDILVTTTTSPLMAPNYTIRISNIDLKYPSGQLSFAINGTIEFVAQVHSWTNYFKAKHSDALELLRNRSNIIPLNMGMFRQWLNNVEYALFVPLHILLLVGGVGMLAWLLQYAR